MKPALLIALIVAAIAGYLLGTESGRERREVLLVKAGRGGSDDTDASESAEAG